MGGEAPIETEDPNQEQEWAGVDRDLFEELRVLRANVAREEKLRPYQVFGDRTLREMAAARPTSLTGLRRLSGIGQRKLEEFGEVFLAAINNFGRRRPELPRDVELGAPAPATRKVAAQPADRVRALAIERLRAGEPVNEVATLVSRAPTTIRQYLVAMIEEERITDPGRWMSRELAGEVVQAFIITGRPDKARPVFDELGGKATWDEIAIALACFRQRETT
jgi:ATP-dependent DNA helicase RecQ